MKKSQKLDGSSSYIRDAIALIICLKTPFQTNRIEIQAMYVQGSDSLKMTNKQTKNLIKPKIVN